MITVMDVLLMLLHDDTAEQKPLEHSHLTKELYESHVILCQDEMAKLEANTRMQFASEL